MALEHGALNVIVRFGDQTAAVRRRVVDFIRRSWGNLDSWREADIDRFVAQVTPVVTAGQLQTASLTDAYLAAVEAAVLGTNPGSVGVPNSVVTNLRGVPTADVYRRTGPTVWRSLADGAPLAVAVAAGLNRATSMAETDLQLARTHASRYVLGRKNNVVGYRRVVSGSACSLCTGSTHRFGKGDLMPIHNGCSCSSIPVFGNGPDPGPDLATGSGDGEDRGEVTVHEHGELGPILSAVGDHFLHL